MKGNGHRFNFPSPKMGWFMQLDQERGRRMQTRKRVGPVIFPQDAKMGYSLFIALLQKWKTPVLAWLEGATQTLEK